MPRIKAVKESVVYASKIANYLFCPHAYLLDCITKEAGLPITGAMAEAAWLKNAFRRLFLDGHEVGPDLPSIERAPLAELPRYMRYKSPEAFAKATAFLGWKNYIIDKRGKVHDRDVVWLYAHQWDKAMGEIYRACKSYYKFLLEGSMPLPSFIDREAAFRFRGRKYVTRLSVVKGADGKCTIGEYGTKKKSQEALDNDWEVTLKVLAFCTLAHDIEALRMKWGLDAAAIRKWDGAAISPEVPFRYYSLLDGKDGAVLEARRDDSHIEPMLAAIESAERAIAERKFEPNHRACPTCRYNVLRPDGVPACDKRAPGVKLHRTMDELMAEREAQEAKKRTPENDA
ncbi:MAG: hypothetical protein QW548_03465 [Candidatus Aenigmatarchaeota archaeon]